MIKLKLVSDSHPLLRAVATPVLPEEIDELVAQVKPLRDFMVKAGGCGLAAPQLGCSKRWFVWTYGMCINPEIISRGRDVTVKLEGCLSFPGRGPVAVTRPRVISVRYTDENKKLQEKKLTGVPSTIFQHENDHLDGKVIY